MPLLPITEDAAACDGSRAAPADGESNSSRRGLPKSRIYYRKAVGWNHPVTQVLSGWDEISVREQNATGKWFHKLKNSSAIRWQAPKMDEHNTGSTRDAVMEAWISRGLG